MQSRKTLATKDDFSLVEVIETDKNGRIIVTAYEVYGPNRDLLESFSDLKDAQDYLDSVLPKSEPPGSSSGLGM